MNIETLVKNLEVTIEGKQWLLSQPTDVIKANGFTPLTPIVKEFIQLNIDELKRILADAKVVQNQMESLQEELRSTNFPPSLAR